MATEKERVVNEGAMSTLHHPQRQGVGRGRAVRVWSCCASHDQVDTLKT